MRFSVWWLITLALVLQGYFLFHQTLTLREELYQTKTKHATDVGEIQELKKQIGILKTEKRERKKSTFSDFSLPRVTPSPPPNVIIPPQPHQNLLVPEELQLIQNRLGKPPAAALAPSAGSSKPQDESKPMLNDGVPGGTWEGKKWSYELETLTNVIKNDMYHENSCHPELCLRQCESSCNQLPKVVYECHGDVRVFDIYPRIFKWQ